MIIGVTGSNGRLGKALVEKGCVPLKCDVRDILQILSELQRVKPDVIIHCAAITDVDKCETKYYGSARVVNGFGTWNLRRAYGRRIIYISTDYVFDGLSGPYTELDIPSPIGIYGQSKLMGEQAILSGKAYYGTVVRTTILYGGHRQDFVTNLLARLKTENTVRVTTRLYGNPTYIPHLVEALLNLCYKQINPEIVHIAGREVLSRYEFALKIADVFGYSPDRIIPDDSMDIGNYRPLKAGLVTDYATKLGLPIYSVDDGLRDLRQRIMEC